MDTRKTEHPARVHLIELHQQGLSYHEIVDETRLNYYTVRKWIRKYKKEGWAAIDPAVTQYQAKGPLSQFDPLVKYVALKLKRINPGWGLDVLLLEMKRRPSLRHMALPSRTALYNYLRPYYHRVRVNRHSRTGRPHPDQTATVHVHQRWQMDFKGEIQVEPAGVVWPFNVCDEHSSAPLAGIIYAAQGHHPQKGMNARDVQQALRLVFSQWGRPHQIRMDRAGIFIGSSRLEWPGLLLLWLVGLDVMPVINRPGRPTDNAQVERLNRTWLTHVGFCRRSASVEDIQLATDKAWHDRLFHLPSYNKYCQGVAPAERFPELFANQRTYQPANEAALFDISNYSKFL